MWERDWWDRRGGEEEERVVQPLSSPKKASELGDNFAGQQAGRRHGGVGAGVGGDDRLAGGLAQQPGSFCSTLSYPSHTHLFLSLAGNALSHKKLGPGNIQEISRIYQTANGDLVACWIDLVTVKKNLKIKKEKKIWLQAIGYC